VVVVVELNFQKIPANFRASGPDGLTISTGRRARVDDGQTNSVSFDTICLAVERRSVPRTADGLTTDRRILLVLTNSVSFDTICLAVERCSEPADFGRVDDGQTNSVLFD
jgi:hypothetical protein